MMSPTEEDFELELRSLPGVLNVGISHCDGGDVDAVTLVVDGQDTVAIKGVASQIASFYYPEAAVHVEDAHRTDPLLESVGARVSLVRADFNAEDGICEVQLNIAGRIGVGRSGSGPLIGGSEATLAALRDLGYEVPFYLVAVVNVSTGRGWPVIVTLRSFADNEDKLGIAQAEGDVISSSKATLGALNRFLSDLKDH